MGAIAPAPWETFFRRRLPHSVCNSARRAHGFGDTVSRPFCPWLQLKNGKGCLYMHLVRHRGGPTSVWPLPW